MSTTKPNVYINSFNRLESLQLLLAEVTDLEEVGNVYIVDNASTYPPLLQFLNEIGHPVIFLKGNGGPRAAYHYATEREEAPFIITDNDLDLRGCPRDLIKVLLKGLETYPDIAKVGPSLRINDLPRESPFYKTLLACEERYWKISRDKKWYEADIDTTFCLCRPGLPFQYGPGLRAYPPYQIRHTPWYLTEGNIPEEERIYLSLLPKTFMKSIGWSTLVMDNRKLFNL